MATIGGVLLLLGPASGTDLAAQRARGAFAAAHPGAAVDLRWFGGVFPAAYSVVTPYVEAVLGARLTGVLAVVAAAPLLATLLVRWRALRPVPAAAYGAAVLAVDMVSGRTAFALGLAVALGALAAVPQPRASWPRWVPCLVLAALATLTSPVAALFMALVALAWAWSRRPVAALALAAAVPMAAIAVLFGEPGRMPFTWPVARPVLLACLAVAVLCRGRPVRGAAVVYAVGTAVVYLLPGPIGSNVERLALLFTGVVLLAAMRAPALLVAVAVAVAAQWTARVPWADLAHAGRIGTEAAASARLVRVLHGLGPVAGRVEVVPFADHGEADVVAAAWPLARGWERQVDVVRARPLYSARLTPAGFAAWLRANSVELVALGRHAHDWSAHSELRILTHPAAAAAVGLVVVHHDPEWTVWRLDGFTPLVQGARLAAADGARLVLRVERPGLVDVGVRWSRWLTVSGGHSCLTRGPTGDVAVRARGTGTVTLASSYLAPLTGHHC